MLRNILETEWSVNDEKNQEESEKIVFAYSGLHEASVLDQNVRFQKALDNVRKEMETLNMNRGGSNTSGFVFENLHVADKNQSNLMSGSQDVLHVIDDNGIADFSVTDAAGNVSYQQAKMGYHGSNKYQITKEMFKIYSCIVYTRTSVFIVCTNQCVSEIPRVLSKEVVVHFEAY